MPTEFQLLHKGKLWGTIRAEVQEDGTIFNVDILPSSHPKGGFRPLFKARVVEAPEFGERLVWTVPEVA